MRGLGEVGSTLMVLLLAFAILTGITVFSGGLITYYNPSNSTNASELVNMTQNFQVINSSTQNLSNTLLNNQATGVSSFIIMLSGVFQAIFIIPTLFNGVFGFVGGIGGFFGGQAGINVGWFITIFLAMIGLFLVWRLLEAGSDRPI